MLPTNWKFMVFSAIFFGFIAFRTRTVFWLLTYGKPALVSARIVRVFQIFAFISLIAVVADFLIAYTR